MYLYILLKSKFNGEKVTLICDNEKIKNFNLITLILNSFIYEVNDIILHLF